MTWYTLFELFSGVDKGPGPGWTVRQAIPVTSYKTGAPSTGTALRVTYRAGSNSLNLPRSFTGHAATSVGSDLVDFDGTQAQLFFTSAAACSVATGGTLVSDGATYSFDKTKPLVISAETSFPSIFLGGTDAAINAVNISGATHAGDTDVTVASTDPGVFLWSKVEVFFTDPPGNPTVTVNKTTTQSDPTSGGTVSFAVAFNKGVTGLTAADFDISASTAGGTLVPHLVGQDFNFIFSVTGMLTVGDITVSLPPGVCFGALGEPNDASTSTDNTVHWDPEVIDPNTPNVYEVTVVDSNMLRIEVREPPNQRGYYQLLGTPDTGLDTFSITGASNNGYGQIRLTTSTAGATSPKSMGSNGGIFILNMTASPVSNGVGGQRIRCQIYDTAVYFTTPGRTTCDIRHARGTTEANSGEYQLGNGAAWKITVINSTQFDLIETNESVPKPAAFVHAYTGGGIIPDGNNGNVRIVTHSVAGTTEANGGWVAARSGLTTIDLTDSYFTNAYSSGGTIIYPDFYVSRVHPVTSALTPCFLPSRFGNVRFFEEPSLLTTNYLNTSAALVPANYALSGGLSVSTVYHKKKPYTMGYREGAVNFSVPNCSFRFYFYLQLSGNLVSSTTYTLQFPSGTGLPPKTFTYNDKVTRCSAINTDQNGHRPGDDGKFSYLSQWIPDYPTYGDYAWPSVTNWHIIDSGGTIVYSAGAAPALRVTATSREGLSFDAPNHEKGPYYPIRQRGPALKVTNVTRAPTGHVTVADGSTLANGRLIGFAQMLHYPLRSLGGPQVGMENLHTDPYNNLVCYRVANLSGNSFDLSVAKAVFSATIAAGGSGYAIGQTIFLNNRVKLQVTAVSGSAVTAVIPIPNEVGFPGIAPNPDLTASGWIDYPYTLPTNPQAQTSSSGGGTGATFNLTWADNPYDRTLLPYFCSFNSANTSSFSAFATSITEDKGNLLYQINESANRAGTNVYGMDYAAATLPAGTYYLYLPNIGVSDPIVIRESAHYDAATCYLKGMYHERSGCVKDGRFGYTSDGPGFKSRPGAVTHKSMLPYTLDRYSLNKTEPNIEGTGPAVPFGGGAGYGPWITTTEQPAFGSHFDAGDWDSRLDETAYYYWGILDVWQHLSGPTQVSLSNQGTPTLLEVGLDPVVFAGTDSMPSPVAEVIYGLEMYRSSQESWGGVIGGLNYGEGVPGPETSSNTPFSIYSWYPDHLVTLKYVIVAAKLAKVLGDLGYTTLAATYQASALAGYNWAVSFITDTAARDAYYLHVKTNAPWTTAQFNDCMTTLAAKVPAQQAAAAACLFNLTGSSVYKTVCDAFYPVGDPDGPYMFGQWEYARATGGTPTPAKVTAIDNQNLAFVERVLLLYAEAPDVAYYAPCGAGRWPMNYGGTNNFQFGHHCIIAALTYVLRSQPTDAARCRRALQNWFGYRNGANQIGLSMVKGLGVRNNRETLHSDSVSTGQDLPIGLVSEGWSDLFPGLPNAICNSNVCTVQHVQADPELYADDATIPYREMYPYDQLAWPRFEFMLEIRGAIEHAEFTVQQHLIPAYSASMFLHGWDGNTATSGITTSTVLVSSLNPSGAGVSVDFTATVTPISGGPVTGSVQFKDAGITIGTVAVDGSGVAVYSTSTLVPASHPITALYVGDGTYDSSTSNTISQVVTGTSSSTALSSSLNPSVLGDSVTFTATVTGSGSPTGTVAFKDGATTLSTGTLIAGVTTFATSLLAVGTHSMTGVYSGDATFTTSTSNTVSQVVQSAAPPGPITLLPQACM